MSLVSLPQEILVKIFHHLLEYDPKAYRNLAAASKRFAYIAYNVVPWSDEWIRSRLFPFNLYLDSACYSNISCESHDSCAEHYHRTKTKCEQQSIKRNTKQNDCNRRVATGNSSQESSARSGSSYDDCFYHRLYCMQHAKFMTFSSVRFLNAELSDRGCLGAFKDSTKLRGLVELELNNCQITLDWLNTALGELHHLKNLLLNAVSFYDSTLLVDTTSLASGKLNLLRISGDRTIRMNDAIFMYFLENFPAIELDLTETRVEYHKRIIQRFYPTHHMYVPSEFILSFPMILQYLKKYQSVTRKFVADGTGITLACLKRIVQDDDLSRLHVSVRNCPLISQFEQTRLAEVDLQRVSF